MTDIDVAHVALIGGHLSLDFANTAGSRTPEGKEERLHRFEDLLIWSERAGAVPSAEIPALRTAARGDPAGATRVLGRALKLREALYRIFSAQAAGQEYRPSDLDVLNAVLRDAVAHRALTSKGTATGWEWVDGRSELSRVLWPIALAAAELLTGGDIGRVKECGNVPCSWLFLDRSRNRSRRWCEMSDCGNRVKVRAFAARRRKKAARRRGA